MTTVVSYESKSVTDNRSSSTVHVTSNKENKHKTLLIRRAGTNADDTGRSTTIT